MYLLNSAQYWVLVLCPWVCQYLPSCLKMFLCISGTCKKKLVYETLIEAEILTSPSPMYLLNLDKMLGTSPLPTGVLTPPKWFKMFLCVSGTSQKNLVYRAIIEAEILTSPLPHIYAQLSHIFGCWHSVCGWVNTSQVVKKCSYMSQEPPK